MTSKRPLGPNVKRLVCQIAAKNAIPPNGGLMDGVRFIRDGLQEGMRKAVDETFTYIDAVRAAPGEYSGATDETIALEIIGEIEKRKAKR
jgi:hypothetical protein